MMIYTKAQDSFHGTFVKGEKVSVMGFSNMPCTKNVIDTYYIGK